MATMRMPLTVRDEQPSDILAIARLTAAAFRTAPHSSGNEQAIVAEFGAILPRFDQRPTVPFNRMDEWGPDGRIKPGAPVYSPFIRRRQRLELE